MHKRRRARKPTGTGIRMADSSWFDRRDEWVGDVEARFNSKVKQDASGCWLWQGSVTHEGYGRFCVTLKDGSEHAVSAHRFAHALKTGRMTKQSVAHECDVPGCVRPQHLFEATHAQNIADKLAKGRQARGEKHGRSAISNEEIPRLLSLRGKLTIAAAALEFAIHRSTVEKYWSERSPRLAALRAEAPESAA